MKNYGFLLSTFTHIKPRRLFTNWLPHVWHLKYISQWSSCYLYKHDLNKDIQVLTDKSISSYNQHIMNLRSSLMVKGVTENIAFPKTSSPLMCILPAFQVHLPSSFLWWTISICLAKILCIEHLTHFHVGEVRGTYPQTPMNKNVDWN